MLHRKGERDKNNTDTHVSTVRRPTSQYKTEAILGWFAMSVENTILHYSGIKLNFSHMLPLGHIRRVDSASQQPLQLSWGDILS